MMKKLYVVGIGPGNEKYMTEQAKQALIDSDVIVGYTVYVELVSSFHEGKEVLSTPMKKEAERCLIALEKADEGKKVAMVCSGDSVVYGMAGLIYRLAQEFPQVEIEVVAGVSAALSGGAVLGAPLTSDFAVISLSDLLTPWEKIEKRLECAAMGDFSVCLYNPSSKKRGDYLKKACDILLKHKDEKTVCGYVKNIGREGEQSVLLTLKELREAKIDMFTTVFIGCEATSEICGKMVTDRGYNT